MALVFTAVKAKIENECAEFLIGGEAESERDFECSTRYLEMLEKAGGEGELEAEMTVYEYGDGERFDASFEELAYLTLRMEKNPSFLESRCNKLSEKTLTAEIGETASPVMSM